MKFVWDSSKATANLAKHGVAFESMLDFEWDRAIVEVDGRKNYGETRFIATSTIYGRVHVLVYTQRGYTFRAISLRKANAREIRKYEKS
jgi:uncharacterized DUF497 family protein